MIDIGSIIKEELTRQERTVTWFAQKLCCQRANIYKIFNKQNIDTLLLHRISVILEHDFFQYYSDLLSNNKNEDK
ncbi:XRE family transcriptional regulator [Bacteroides sp. 519]|nr:XRE family transcriptional regulator [Bacteroides sp. 519]NDV59256.1 XRE family transcriptional regulator [Bacteroides sp. 519]